MDRLHDLIQRYCPNGVVFARIADIADISIGEFVHKSKQSPDGKYPVYNGGTTNTGFYDDFNRTANKIIISARGANAGYVNRVFTNFWSGNSCYSIDVENTNADWNFVFYCLKNGEKKLLGEQQKGGIPAVSKKQVEQFRIPLPPLAVQQEIVRILDSFTELTVELNEKLTAELTARRKQYEHYRDELLTFGDDIVWTQLKNIATFKNGKGHERKIVEDGPFIVVNSRFISSDGVVKKYSEIQIVPLVKNDILMVMSDLPNGKALAKCFVVDADNTYTLNQRICALHVKDTVQVNTSFLYYFLNRNKQLLKHDNGVDQTNLKKDDILEILVPVLPLSQQMSIVSILDSFYALCTNLTSGLPAEIAARQKQYEYYRDKLLTFKEKME